MRAGTIAASRRVHYLCPIRRPRRPAPERPVMEFFKTGYPTPGPEYLKPTYFFDFDQPIVRNFAAASTVGATSDVEKALKLYYTVRDQVRYDPYSIVLEPKAYKASTVLAQKLGFCLPKASLLVALARAVGIPTAIGMSDVRNHISTERLKRIMGSCDLFIHHGYAVMYLEGKWVKAAPAFNIELCNRFNVLPTEWDGRSHALFQPYDAAGRRHMEYVADHGVWSDFPFERVDHDFRSYYPAAVFDSLARDQALKGSKTEVKFEEERPLA